MSKRCLFCDAPLQEGDKVCPYCGKPQERAQPEAQKTVSPPEKPAPPAQPKPQMPPARPEAPVSVAEKPQKGGGTWKIGVLIAVIGVVVAAGVALAGYFHWLPFGGSDDKEETVETRRDEREDRDDEDDEPEKTPAVQAPAEDGTAAALADLVSQSEARRAEAYGDLEVLQEAEYSEGQFDQYAGTVDALRTDIADLRAQAEALNISDPALQNAADEYFGMVSDSQEALFEIWNFMADYFQLGDSVMFYKPQPEDYSYSDDYLYDLETWYEESSAGYAAIDSCPSCMENQWAQYGKTLDLNDSICDKLYLADLYDDPLRRESALNMADRFEIADEVRYGEILDALEGELNHSDYQRSVAAELAAEIEAYADLDAEARAAYTFQNIHTGEVLLDYDVVDTIYPSLYNSYDAFLVVKTGCVSGSSTVLVEAEIPGLTQTYKETFLLDSAYKAIYIKPPALTGELDLTDAKSAQINVTVSAQDGTVLGAKSFPITIKSQYDFEWYSDEYGLSTQDNILCFMTPEAKAIADLKRVAIDEISKMTDGQMESFVGYQGNAWGDNFVGTFLQAAGVMRALNESGVRYNMDTFSLSGSNQHILFPEDVLSLKSGLCVETSLVVASALQSAGMHTFLIFPPGHAQVAVEIWDGYGSDTSGTGQYFLIETTALEDGWNNTEVFRADAESLLDGWAENNSPISYLNADQWEEYLGSDTYVIDCNDYDVLGITPFAN